MSLSQGDGSSSGYRGYDDGTGQCEAEELGVQMEELLPTSVTIQVANREPALRIKIVVVSGKDEAGILITTRQ